MRVSLSWLNDYVPVEMDIDRLVDALTMVGLEVESVADRYAYLQTVFTGRIRTVAPHPNADHLKVCEVDLDGMTTTVVCGAPNVRPDLSVALARPGTVLSDGSELQKSVIRGITSDGMLCSARELGLGLDASGIMELQGRPAPGTPLASALGLSDTVLEVALTPNRPDCLSMVGIAREVAAIQGSSLRYPDTSLAQGRERIEALTSVDIQAPELCYRYAARLLSGVSIQPSPFWLQDRLLSVGLRPINNIVDVTNFVLMELGQPLHAFDFDRLSGRRIVVRTAAEGETFVTLDNKERPLTAQTLMICDAERAVAIGGIMGGLNSEIESSTTRVLIESACFNPLNIRKTAKQLGLSTEASYRFERGVDPGGTVFAMERAAKLMAEVSGAEIVNGIIDNHPRPPAQRSIRLGVAATNRLLGTAFRDEQIADSLRRIEFQVTPGDGGELEVVAPSYRVDVSRPEDLMEEVARLAGYNNIPLSYPAVPAEGRPLSKRQGARRRVRGLMEGCGFNEVINYSFIAPDAVDRIELKGESRRRRVVSILNPISEEMAVLRTSLIPGLLETMRRNAALQAKNLRLYEVGRIYLSTGHDALPQEVEMLAALWCGARLESGWYGKESACDFFDLKGIVETLLERLAVRKVRFTALPAKQCEYTRPGFSARIVADAAAVGLIGEIHPRVAEHYELKQTAFIFELDFGRLGPLIPDVINFQPLPRYPAVFRDVTLIVDRSTEAGEILRHIEALKHDLVEALHLFDVFEGAPIPAGRKSISFRITYRSSERTLEDKEINRLHRDITGTLLKEFSASLPA